MSRHTATAEELKARSDSKSLGGVLRIARIEMGISQRAVEVATRSEVSNAYLSQIESGKIAKPSPQTLYALAGALSLNYQDLMDLAGYPRAGHVTADPNYPTHIDRDTPYNRLHHRVIELEAALTTEREKLTGLVEASEAVLAIADRDTDAFARFRAAIAAAKGGV